MFERFTDRARRALVHAQQESIDHGHGFIGTEHLLLGLLREGEGVASVVLTQHGVTLDDVRRRVLDELGVVDPAAALATIGIDLDEVRRTVEANFGEGALKLPAPQPPFTPLAKRSLELALQEALRVNHYYIGTEHLILGLLAEEQGLAVRVLAEAGCDVAAVRDGVLQLIAPEIARVHALENRILQLPTTGSAAEAIARTARQAWAAARQRHAEAVRPLTAELADAVERALTDAEAALAADASPA
jgi:ATP-dependent Clp protease ATP-binding subunit ClpC